MDKMNPLPGGYESHCAPLRGRRIRLHVYKHFPEGMCPHTPDGPSGNDLAHWRVAVLRRLAEFLTGVPQLENLCCLLDEQWHDPVGEVTPPIAEEILDLSWRMMWNCPTPITLQPIAAPAALLHWRPFAFLFSLLSSEEKKELHFGRRGGGSSGIPWAPLFSCPNPRDSTHVRAPDWNTWLWTCAFSEEIPEEQEEICRGVLKQEATFVDSLPEGSPQKIMWAQQAKAATTSARGMRWHPSVLRMCIALHAKSTSAYNVLRKSGFLRLPHENTLFNYIFIHILQTLKALVNIVFDRFQKS